MKEVPDIREKARKTLLEAVTTLLESEKCEKKVVTEELEDLYHPLSSTFRHSLHMREISVEKKKDPLPYITETVSRYIEKKEFLPDWVAKSDCVTNLENTTEEWWENWNAQPFVPEKDEKTLLFTLCFTSLTWLRWYLKSSLSLQSILRPQGISQNVSKMCVSFNLPTVSETNVSQPSKL